MGLFKRTSGGDSTFAGAAGALLTAACIQQQDLADEREKAKRLEKALDGLRKQSQKSKGLAAGSVSALHQQQNSSARSIKKLSLACGKLSLHSAIVQQQYDALLQQLVECQQRYGKSDRVKGRQMAELVAQLSAKGDQLSALQVAHMEAEAKLLTQELEVGAYKAQLSSKGEEVAALQAAQVVFKDNLLMQETEMGAYRVWATCKGEEVAALQAARVEVEEMLLLQDEEIDAYRAQLAAKSDELAAKSDLLAALQADKLAAEQRATSQDKEIAALKAKLVAKEQEAALLLAAKAEAEQKLLLQVEAKHAALQAQAETCAALAASQEVNHKLLAQQNTDRAKPKVEQKVPLQAEVSHAAWRAHAETRAALVASEDRNQQLLEQQKEDKDALAALREEVEFEKSAIAHYEQEAQKYIMKFNDQHKNVLALISKVAACEGEVKGLERHLTAANQLIIQQQFELREQDWELQQKAACNGYGAFIDAVDRGGQVSRALETCMLNSSEILNTPAAALCIAAGLGNSSYATLQRVYYGLCMGCHSDKAGGGDKPQQQLNQVWDELQRQLAAPAAVY